MGYILPIHNYQSQDYHERMIQPERDPIPVDRIFKKRIEPSYFSVIDTNKFYSNESTDDSNDDYSMNKYQMVIPEQQIEVYAEITGIGGRINEYV